MPVPFRKAPLAAAIGAAIGAPVTAHAVSVETIGDEFDIPEPSTESALEPDAAMDDDGNFVVVWSRSTASYSSDIFARRCGCRWHPTRVRSFACNHTA
ncbi:MAG: hypothetical protein U5K33_05185 [Halofilum sp. (in: g-proteobacteria)]|nr:hypothetical protein [Halofilum sp. (in: g-proteobacteria)]